MSDKVRFYLLLGLLVISLALLWYASTSINRVITG